MIINRNKNFFLLLFALCLTLTTHFTYAQKVNSLIKKGQREYEDNNVEAALEYFEQVLSVDRNNYTAAYFAGVSYLRLAFPKKSLDRFSIIRPERFKLTRDLYFWLAYSNFKNNKFEEAEEYIAQHRNAYKNYMRDELEQLEKNIASAKVFYDEKKPFRIENLGDNINSENPEYAAVLTANHRTVHFTTRRKDNKGGEKSGEYMEDILSSSMNENDQWSKADRLKGLVTVGHDATVQLFGDDKKMIIYQKKDLLITELKDGKWGHPKSIGKEINNKRSRESHGFITQDGNTLIFSSDYKTKNEDLDLFISRKQPDGEWGRPRPINEINTEKDEDSPFVAGDGTLYFASKGHNSMGGFDIFKSEYNPTSRKFEKPINMGYPLNSVSDDIFFNVKNGIAYFTSNRAGGLGREDIYRAYLFEEVNISLDFVYKDSSQPISDAVVYLESNSNSERLALKTDASGKVSSMIPAFQDFTIQLVKDGETLHTQTLSPLTSLKDPINFSATVKVSAKQDIIAEQKQEEMLNENEGQEELISENLEQEIAKEENEINKTEQIDKAPSMTQNSVAEQQEMEAKKRELDAQFKNASGKFVLKRIYFDHNEARLKSESFNELNGIVAYLKDNQNIRAEISGHTDNIGPKDYNENLSLRRARAVVNYLIDNGIEANRLQAKGYGETQPLVSNDDERDGREINRRIELKVLKSQSDGFSKNY